ncbi:MAG: hypothetical protein HQL60_03465 [Magnetococcales bacterium]|nr:hypothetical protein [Magnetococcales bacterium]
MTTPNPDWIEGDIHFDFSKARSVLSLDHHGRGHGLNRLMKAVDFVVEWEDAFWLVEVKDPDQSKIPSQHRDTQQSDFLEKMRSRSLIHAELFPKFIDSLIYLGLDRGIPAKPLRYLTLIGMTGLDPSYFTNLSAALLQHHDGCLRGPQPNGWAKGFSAHLFNLELWNRKFPDCPVTRVGIGRD